MSDDKATKQEKTMIEPIKLLAGSHKDTASTGQGCFMNVIAYLNGEAQITDKSECVCFVMRPLAIYANDLFNDEDRQRLLPFILRAIGSRTDDKEVITERLRHVVAFAEKQSKSAAKSAEYAEYAAEYAKSAAKSAESAEYAAEYAKSAESAECAAEYAEYAAEWYKTTRDDLLTMFDACFPQLTKPQAVHLERAKRLHEMDDRHQAMAFRDFVPGLLKYADKKRQAAQAAPVEPVARLTDAEIEQGRQEIFSVNNPYCPCDIKTMQKAVRWAERTIAARTTTPPASLT
ncbi:hypothetical protein [Aquidulcibacter sp.]|uniref:hypothetical protein n=1 Tax=Aquidulcibacter sp. TaxID=2052990 RepID=UPI0025C1E682|nr:hypothetical protein [Aquidulcibacter sp.]MCA3694227.1 hypothetical protein [Aquidulcibacter sp.]